MKKRLSELTELSLGVNPSRVKDVPVYTQEDLEYWLIHCREPNGFIISLINNKAAPTGYEKTGKVLTSNYLECIVDTNVLNPLYFCYLFNENKDIKTQIEKMHQMSTIASVKRIPVQALSQLEIELPDINEQRKIGKIYQEALKLKYLINKQADDLFTATMEIISKAKKEGEQ